MMRTCRFCSRSFCRPYSLRRHVENFHSNKEVPGLERQCRGGLSRVGVIKSVNINQYGGSILNNNESSDDDADDDSSDNDGASMENNVGSEHEDESSSGEVEDDDDDDDYDDSDEDNSIFDDLIEQAENELGQHARVEDIRKLFRRKLANEIEWMRALRRHSIYKKIINTAKDLEDGPGDYDKSEALRAAIRTRSILLNDLIPDPDSDQVEEMGDDRGGSDSGV